MMVIILFINIIIIIILMVVIGTTKEIKTKENDKVFVIQKKEEFTFNLDLCKDILIEWYSNPMNQIRKKDLQYIIIKLFNEPFVFIQTEYKVYKNGDKRLVNFVIRTIEDTFILSDIHATKLSNLSYNNNHNFNNNEIIFFINKVFMLRKMYIYSLINSTHNIELDLSRGILFEDDIIGNLKRKFYKTSIFDRENILKQLVKLLYK